jgi:hypothetical protein
MSRVAATTIKGRMMHSAIHLNKKEVPTDSDTRSAWAAARMVTIDETPFASAEGVRKAEKNLRLLKQDLQPHFGGLDAIFCGDLRQLEPVRRGSTKTCDDLFPELHRVANCRTKLSGLRQFENGEEHGPSSGDCATERSP